MADGLTDAHYDWAEKFCRVSVSPAGAGADDDGRTSKQPDLSQQTPQHTKDPNQELFLKEPGDAQDISDDDIHQGRLGDCYLLSSLGEIARINPAVIRQMVKDNGDGTYTVTLYKRKSGAGHFIAGALTGHPAMEPVKITVDGNFPTGTDEDKGSANQGADQDKVGSKKEIWVQVIEKAYAKLNGGYKEISGGHASDAMTALTGQDASESSMTGFLGIGGVSQDDLVKAFQAGKPVVLNTPKKDNLPFNLVGPHAYMLEDIVVGTDGKAMVTLRNPWGDNPGNANPLIKIKFEDLSKGITSVDIGGALPKPPPPPAQPSAPP